MKAIKILTVLVAVVAIAGVADVWANCGQTRVFRSSGSGGANDLGSLCWKVLVITPHDRRRFVERVDFVTTPGYLTGPGAREAAGLPPGTGPYRVITDLAIMGYDDESKQMQVVLPPPTPARLTGKSRPGKYRCVKPAC